MNRCKRSCVILVACAALAAGTDQGALYAQQSTAAPIARFGFDGTVEGAPGASVSATTTGPVSFIEGLDGEALTLSPSGSPTVLSLSPQGRPFDRDESFSVQYWVRTTAGSENRTVMLSQKEVVDNSLAAQKQAGWVFYISDGTWAWNMGSGTRRITYERDNGEHMPLNDGRWHQLAMTYDSVRSEVRLYYDGHNKVVYNVHDAVGFDFTNDSPLRVGWAGTEASPQSEIVPAIYQGATRLQELVDVFDGFGLPPIEPDELVNLMVEPDRLFEEKTTSAAAALGAEGAAFLEAMRAVDFDPVSEIEADLMDNPYTIHQAFSFMEAAPAMKIFSLADGNVTINEDAARAFTEAERLYPPEFDMDDLTVWNRALTADEILAAYAVHFKPVAVDLPERRSSITAGAWNIFHGGKHFTVGEHGWDSRVAIAQILARENVDIVMMQETYSSGDFIAAELGYYFATTVDRDYLNQGANISVLSRYPIEEIHVQEDSAFMNVAARIAISETQTLYAMSNWYGMAQFPDVVDFHRERFDAANVVPIVFAGDFNAIPHTDGGDSPASKTLQDDGFTDAFRSTHPDVTQFPGYSHRSGQRIDQLYYKGSALRNTETRLITTWPIGFPSDHYLIRSTFELR